MIQLFSYIIIIIIVILCYGHSEGKIMKEQNRKKSDE